MARQDDVFRQRYGGLTRERLEYHQGRLDLTIARRQERLDEACEELSIVDVLLAEKEAEEAKPGDDG